MNQTIGVNITPQSFQPTLHYSQGDVGRVFVINVTDYDIPTGATVTCVATKPSGMGFTVSGTVSGNSVTFTSTAEMTDEWGRFPAEIRIASGNTLLGTANFLMIGEKDPHPASTIDGTQEELIPQLTLLVNRVEAAAESVHDLTVSATTLTAGSDATATYDSTNNSIAFGIPRGADGDVTRSEFNDLKSDLSNLVAPINVPIVSDEYITTGGVITPYNGWSRTDYIDCSEQTKFYVVSTGATTYTHFYDTDKNPIGSWFQVNAGTTEITVPHSDYSNVKYFIISNASAIMSKLVINYSLTDKTLSLEDRPADAKTVGTKFEQVASDMDTVSNSLEFVSDNLDASFAKDPVFTDISNELTWTRGAYWWQNKSETYANMAWALVGKVSAGDTFRISSRAVGGVNALILADANGAHIAVFGAGAGFLNNEIFTMPNDGFLYTNTEIHYLDDGLYQLGKATQFLYKTKSSLSDVNWVTIGDSLNDFAVLSNNWIRYMVNSSGANITNLALSGTGFYRTSDYDTPSNYATRISSIPQDAELITIAGSFNDLMSSPTPNIPVGTATDTGTDTLAGWMSAFFDALLTAFPHTPIGVYMTSPWDRYHYGSTQSDAYVAVLKEICLTRGIPFNDDCYYGSLRPWDVDNRTYYYTKENGTVDGVHPNAEGHKIIYQRLKRFIESLPCNTQ